jgi:hypothetical protein
MPVSLCLSSTCSHLSEIGQVKIVMQNDGDFVDVILKYLIYTKFDDQRSVRTCAHSRVSWPLLLRNAL